MNEFDLRLEVVSRPCQPIEFTYILLLCVCFTCWSAFWHFSN